MLLPRAPHTLWRKATDFGKKDAIRIRLFLQRVRRGPHNVSSDRLCNVKMGSFGVLDRVDWLEIAAAE